MSTAIVIQDIDDATAEWIREEAERRGIKEELLVLQLLRDGIRIANESSLTQQHHDLDSLAGTWSEEQAAEFAAAESDFERVDEKLWR